MILKQVPEDFIVREIYDLNLFKEKNEEKNRVYQYLLLKKRDYSQVKAIDVVAKAFNTSRRYVHFAGSKDRLGVTYQVISIFSKFSENFEEHIIYFNQKHDNDLNLEYLGEFKGRINLGDNGGNRFDIMVRSLTLSDIENSKKKLLNLEKEGVLNFFDEQRFGYANNSHIIGEKVLKNEIRDAVFEILTSIPKNPSEDLFEFVKKIKESWKSVYTCDIEIIDNLIEICPKFLNYEKQILEHLKTYKNDFPGAFRKLPKKIRTLYINAFQSYIFNETILHTKDLPDEIELVWAGMDLEINPKTLEILKKKEMTLENFKLKSMPELHLNSIFRKVRVFPKGLEMGETLKDELNEGKFKILVKFSLGRGEYATNVVKQLFIK